MAQSCAIATHPGSSAPAAPLKICEDHSSRRTSRRFRDLSDRGLIGVASAGCLSRIRYPVCASLGRLRESRSGSNGELRALLVLYRPSRRSTGMRGCPCRLLGCGVGRVSGQRNHRSRICRIHGKSLRMKSSDEQMARNVKMAHATSPAQGRNSMNSNRSVNLASRRGGGNTSATPAIALLSRRLGTSPTPRMLTSYEVELLRQCAKEASEVAHEVFAGANDRFGRRLTGE